MEIEQKERERIELCANAFSDQRIENDYTSFIEGSINEHLHLQKEVIQPLRDQNESLKEDTLRAEQHAFVMGAKNKTLEEKVSKLEAEIKALREAAQNLMTAIEQRSFFQEGYRNGSSSISEVIVAGDVEVKAYEAMGKLLTKNEG